MNVKRSPVVHLPVVRGGGATGHSSTPRTVVPRVALTRRGFVQLASLAPTVVCVGCAEDGLDVLEQDFVVTLSEHPELAVFGESLLIDAGLLRPLAVTRVDEVTFVVTGTECNHAHCGVERNGEGWRCPCHGSRFDLDGSRTSGPASLSLTLYDWDLEGDILTVLADA